MGKILLTESELQKLIKSIIDNLLKKGESKKKIEDILKEKFPKIFKSEKVKIPDKKENEKPDDSEESDEDMSTSDVNSKWMSITRRVIDKLEGGYWNPTCGHPTKGMGKSTETLFGLDRFNGNIESTENGRKFFRIIDNEKKKGLTNFCKEWKWLYRGGEKEDQLEILAAKIMKNYFDNNMSTFVKSKKLKNKILNNDALLFHMSYATWNGPLYFQNFAKSLQNGLDSGKTTKQLIELACDDRKKTKLYNQDKVISEIKSLA
jgi:hypothetical protein